MKNSSIRKGAFAASLLLWLIAVRAEAQARWFDDSANVISDSSGTLDGIFSGLHALERNSAASMLPILHIGDSHLQAGVVARSIRGCLQARFGNAGRGLIVPIRLAKSNQPTDYSIASPNKWEGGRCAVRKIDYPFGIGGFALQTREHPHSFALTPKPDTINKLDYSFNKITVFHQSAARLSPVGIANYETVLLSNHTYQIELRSCVSELALASDSLPAATPFAYHGFSLENGNPGVLFHNIGVNAATYKSYTGIPIFYTQASALNPRLIIISLGTNEAFGGIFDKQKIVATMDSLVCGLKKACPEAVFLLTTPVESYKTSYHKRKKYQAPHPRIAEMSAIIVGYARERHIAYWDLFAITGGKGSAAKWLAEGYFARDKVHFTSAGYRLQGELFNEAFIKSYDRYAQARRK